MNILEVCASGDVLSTIRIVKIVLNIIRIIVPIILILTLVLAYMGAVKEGDDDTLNKVNKSIVSRAIAVGAIILMPTFINIVLKVISTDNNDYYNCMENATKEGISTAYTDNANQIIDNVKNTLEEADYQSAINAIKKVENEESKAILNSKLTLLKYYVDLRTQIKKINIKKDRKRLNEIKKEIEGIEDEVIKDTLTKAVEKISSGKILNAEAGSSYNTYDGSGGKMDYYVFVPENATTNMPLIVYLHGDGSVANAGNLQYGEMAQYVNDTYGTEFPFIYIQPHTDSDWTSGNIPNTLKELIDYIVDEYACDPSNISLSGGSRGAMGAWYMANVYGNYFSAFMPISGTGNINPGNFVDLPTWAFSSTHHTDSWNYSNMQSNVNAINNSGGHATFTPKPGYTHSTILSGVFNSTTFGWLISQ